MDLGMVGFDGFVGPDASSLAPPLLSPSPPSPPSLAPSDPDQQTKQKWYGSGFLKQQRSGTEDDWCRSLKVAKTDDFSASKAMLLPLQQQQRGPFLRSNSNVVSTTTSSSSLFYDSQHQQQQQQQMMLSFSSPNSQTVTFPNYYHHPSSTFTRNSGYGGSGGLNAASASMHGVFTGVRGPFTPSQWMELEHQALIYKYLTENVPIPSNLLIPIRKALDSAGFSSFSGGPLSSSTLGWGAFRLGFSNTTDPEPGRCRRTDGKKWRCSRDAVADQKYCERHMNRGRHRSRKPVEGQSGHSVAGQPTTTPKLVPVASSASASVVPGGGVSNSLGLSHHPQLKNLHPSAPHLSASSSPNRIFVNKDNAGERIQGAPDLSILSPPIGLRDTQFPIPKHQNPYEESARAEFGRVCSDSLLNPFHKTSPLISCRNYGSSQDPNDAENQSQRSVRQFMDDWPKNHTDRSPISWPNLDLQPDRTQLSISIPMAASDFMSSTSSPVNEKLALSPLRLSRELESTRMGLGVGSMGNEPNQRQSNLIPISWEASVGGPLGEVLHSTTSSASAGAGASDYKNTSALNLMTEGWDISPRLASSPTGVLQKMTFGSLSNSSAGSSPRAENNHKTTHEVGAAFCNDLLGSTLLKSSSLPAL